jgi:hypothetical protein
MLEGKNPWNEKCSTHHMLTAVLSSVSIGPNDIGEHTSQRRPPTWLHPRLASGKRTIFQIVLILSAFASFTSWTAAQTPNPEFMPLDSARPVLQKMSSSDPAAPPQAVSPADWLAWLKQSDAQIRQRLDVGEEDSLTNLLRFGVTYTKEYRIDDDYLVLYGKSTLVNAFAENRANDLIKALAAPNRNQGFIEMRAFVEKKGYSLNSPEQRQKLKAYLLANLSRMQKDLLQAREQAKTNRSQMFQNRGISLDSNLWPDYDLDLSLQTLLKQGMLKPGSIRRVAIVGPGLDFVNKQQGVDYYPPQTTQPFAVLDSLFRLGLAKPEDVELDTFDISSRVNLHIEIARKNAALGRGYTVQLPWFTEGRWSDDFRAKFTQYWQNLGAQIGQPVAAIPVPQEATGFTTKAVDVRPAIVSRVKPVDMNIVFQRLPLAPEQRFDLIIGTNIFLYYGGFEQALARANVAAMLKPGGYLLSNDKLEDTVPSGLEQISVTEIPMTGPPVITDYIYCYRRME